jgi:ABC-type multidrug transport system ATPase subunit
MSDIIKVSGLTKQFQNLTAVNNLSFTVQQGNVYGFLGQNGAGKSTTIRMLLTLIAPTAGDIEIFGLKLKTHRNDILKQTGAVIEKPDVYKYLSAFENLKLFSRLSGVKLSSDQLMQQLEIVGLASRARDLVKTYSQGMKQRLGIAIALVHNPELIILDEPTNGLDPQGIADIRNLILHLSKEQKKTIVVSSHLLNEIEQIATKVLIIDKGKKVREGLASELFDPSSSLIELTTTHNERCRDKLLNSNWKDFLVIAEHESIFLKMNKQSVPALNRYLVEQNIEVLSLQQRNSLEDYFLSVTTGNQHVEAFSN